MSAKGHVEREYRSAQHEGSARGGRGREVTMHAREAGVSLVELLVGILIGLIATAVIYQTFAVSEAFKRNTTGAGDAQQNGLLSTFMLAQDISNAGNALASAAFALDACPKDVGTTDPVEWMKLTARPLPIMIVPGDGPEDPDQFIVNYAVPRTIVYPAPFKSAAGAGDSYEVQSPLGFAKGDMVVAIGGGNCDRRIVTDVSPADAATGVVTINHRADPNSPSAAHAFDLSAVLFNLGTAPDAAGTGQPHVQRIQFAVCYPKGTACVPRSDTSAGDRARINGALRSKDLLDDGTFQPIASNIVNMKLQYGIDNDGTGVKWVSPHDAPWRPEDLRNADWKTISLIKAVRIGLVVSSSQYDREIKEPYTWVLFDCPDGETCPAPLSGTIPVDSTGSGGFRYRVYETVVPLRNSLWNRQL